MEMLLSKFPSIHCCFCVYLMTIIMMIPKMMPWVMQCCAGRDSDRWLLSSFWSSKLPPSSWLVANEIIITFVLDHLGISGSIIISTNDHPSILKVTIFMLIKKDGNSHISVTFGRLIHIFWTVHNDYHIFQWCWWWKANDSHKDKSLFHTGPSIYWCRPLCDGSLANASSFW